MSPAILGAAGNATVAMAAAQATWREGTSTLASAAPACPPCGLRPAELESTGQNARRGGLDW